MKPKILLIEDDDLIRDLYEKELIKAGFEVQGVNNGDDGLKAITESKHDLVLLDIMLPGLNGLEILKQTKQNPKTKDTRIVLLTNLGQDPIIKEAFALGAEGYLIKVSYNPDQVVSEVKNFLAGKSGTYPET